MGVEKTDQRDVIAALDSILGGDDAVDSCILAAARLFGCIKAE